MCVRGPKYKRKLEHLLEHLHRKHVALVEDAKPCDGIEARENREPFLSIELRQFGLQNKEEL